MNNHNKMRHQAEITGECQISLESIPNRPYAFSVLPSKIDRLYILDAQTKQDRVFFFLSIFDFRICGFIVFKFVSF